MGGARGQAAFAFDGEDPDLARARQLECQGLARSEWHAVARGARVGLQEEGPARGLGVAGQPAPAPQPEQVLPGEGVAAVLGKGEARVARALGAGAEALVEDGESGVNQRDDVAGGEDEAVAEPAPRPADVPAHRAREEQRQHHVDLGARAAGMPALAVVEGQVDALVDEVLEHLVVGEVALRQSVQMLNRGAGVEARIRGRADGGGGRPSGRRQETAAPPRASTIGSTTARVRLNASAMFSRELA